MYLQGLGFEHPTGLCHGFGVLGPDHYANNLLLDIFKFLLQNAVKKLNFIKLNFDYRTLTLSHRYNAIQNIMVSSVFFLFANDDRKIFLVQSHATSMTSYPYLLNALPFTIYHLPRPSSPQS